MMRGDLRKRDILSVGVALPLSIGLFAYLHYNGVLESLVFAGFAFAAMVSVFILGRKVDLDTGKGKDPRKVIAFLFVYSAISILLSFMEETLHLRSSILFTSVLSFSVAVVVFMEKIFPVFALEGSIEKSLEDQKVREFLFTPPGIPHSKWLNKRAKELSLILLIFYGFAPLIFLQIIGDFGQLMPIYVFLISSYTYFFTRIRREQPLTAFEWCIYASIKILFFWL